MRFPTLFFFALMLIAAPAAGQGVSETINAAPGGSLDLRLEAGGSLTIEGWSRDQVQIVAEPSGRDADLLDVSIDSRGDRVLVRAEFDKRNANADVTYAVRVPGDFDVTFWLSGGSVSISGVAGDLDGQTMGGELVLTDLEGRVDVTTMGGAITLEKSRVSGRVKTMGGSITLDDIEGDVNANTMGGDITYRNVRPLGNEVTEVQTMGGDIEVSAAPAGADVETMGGDIRVGSAGAFLRAETMGGDIDAEEVGGWVEARTMGGDVSIGLVGGNDGDRHVDISSMGGDVELIVPSGMSMDVDIEIEVRGRDVDADNYTIESDFDLKVDHPKSFEGRGDNRHLTLSATGSIGGGRHEVRIRTVNGNVRLRR